MCYGRRLVWVALVVVLCGADRTIAADAGTSWGVVDVRTGTLLLGERVDEARALGTGYQLLVLLSALEQAQLGMLPLDVPVSADPATLNQLRGRPGERLKLTADKTYLLSDLLKAIVLTGSDVAAAVAAEAMWGSRSNAVEALNERAKRMGLAMTQVADLTADAEGNMTTVAELGRLVAVLWREHREVREWGTLRGFPFDGGRLLLANGHLPPREVGVWAFYHRSSAPRGKRVSLQRVGLLVGERDGMTLAAVRLGDEDVSPAVTSLVEALRQAFEAYEPVTLVRAGEPLKIRVAVEGGEEPFIVPHAGDEVRIPRRKGSEEQVQLLFQLPSLVTAPVARGERIGEVVVEVDRKIVAVVPAISPKTIASSGVRAAEAQWRH